MLRRTVGYLGSVAGAAGAALLLCFPGRAAETGFIYVETAPPGASVFVDDEKLPRGVSPCLLPDMTPGAHTFRVRLDGYAEAVAELTAVAGEVKKTVFKLEKGSASPQTKAPAAGEGFVVAPKETPEPPEGPTATEPAEPAPEEPARPVAPARPRAPARLEVPAQKDKPPPLVDVECPLCEGSGLRKTMGCVKCRALGRVGYGRRCGTCEGSGRADLPCPFCRGRGKSASGGGSRECSRCKGKGYPPCPMCKGAGTIKRPNPDAAGKPTVSCHYCDATGFLRTVKCKRCTGKGEIRSTSESLGGGFRGYTRLKCPVCKGERAAQPMCRPCYGKGYVGSERAPIPCRGCYGTGHLFQPCPGCRGKAWLIER